MALDKFQPYLFVSAGEQSNKYLTPTITNGIAQFQAQRAQSLTGLTVRIEPIQEGSGDPSPSNIRPISGRTGLTVTAAGKNLLALPASAITTNGVTAEATPDGELWVHGTPTIESGYFSFSLPQLPKVVVDKTVSISINEKMVGIGITFDAGDAKLNLTLASTDTHKTGVYRSGGGRNPRVNVRYDVGAINKKFQIQLEIASAPSAFVPYVAPTTYPITWESIAGTVYGGTLDVVSGALTVDWDYIASYNGETLPGEWISDRDVYAEGTTPTTGAEVAYKLAEPVTYQLDPEQVMTLPGYTQIYSDAGPLIDIKF